MPERRHDSLGGAFALALAACNKMVCRKGFKGTMVCMKYVCMYEGHKGAVVPRAGRTPHSGVHCLSYVSRWLPSVSAP